MDRYAIIKTGGKQYRISKGETFKVEKVKGDIGDTIEMDDVLFLGNGSDSIVGTPFVKNAKVITEIVKHERGKKIIVFKYKRRKNYKKKMGHRQSLTNLKVKEIVYNHEN
ncbi:MAG: 50S ribosomal protein L21 [Thermodesulfobacteriota bacterium]|nr:50S ribosomal protein L21 [Thermodesulfobacteriota bacterium]